MSISRTLVPPHGRGQRSPCDGINDVQLVQSLLRPLAPQIRLLCRCVTIPQLTACSGAQLISSPLKSYCDTVWTSPEHPTRRGAETSLQADEEIASEGDGGRTNDELPKARRYWRCFQRQKGSHSSRSRLSKRRPCAPFDKEVRTLIEPGTLSATLAVSHVLTLEVKTINPSLSHPPPFWAC